MPRKPTDPITEVLTQGDVQYRTTRRGWLGTDSYEVEVVATYKPTLVSALATNDNPYEAPTSVRRRAYEQLLETL